MALKGKVSVKGTLHLWKTFLLTTIRIEGGEPSRPEYTSLLPDPLDSLLSYSRDSRPCTQFRQEKFTRTTFLSTLISFLFVNSIIPLYCMREFPLLVLFPIQLLCIQSSFAPLSRTICDLLGPSWNMYDIVSIARKPIRTGARIQITKYSRSVIAMFDVDLAVAVVVGVDSAANRT